MVHFIEEIKRREAEFKTLLCIGLDTVPGKFPASLESAPDPQFTFNKAIIDATHDLVVCYKPNFAFYAARGADGLSSLIKTIEYCHEKNAPVLLDAKFGDIGNTAGYYARTAFEALQADSVTLNPYMGEDSIAPFREYDEKVSFILCFTSNVSRIDFQTRTMSVGDREPAPMYEAVAEKIKDWNQKGNLGAVVGATAPEEMQRIRAIFGQELPVLCPGIGVQGGDLEEILWSGYTQPGSLILNVSRAVLYASSEDDFAQAARREAKMFVSQMRAFLERVGDTVDETVE